MVRGLVFDFDGLILDTERAGYETWREVYRAHGLGLGLDFWKTLIGRGSNFFDPLADLESKLGRGLDGEAIRAARRVREAELLAGLPVLPGVVGWRAEAAAMGIRTAVASSSTRRWVQGHLDRLGLGNGWACVRCRDDVERAKPDPDLYLAALGCLGVAAHEALAVEDSPPGVAAAKAAGIFCVAVPSELTTGMDFSRADLVLGSLADRSLAEVLELVA